MTLQFCDLPFELKLYCILNALPVHLKGLAYLSTNSVLIWSPSLYKTRLLTVGFPSKNSTKAFERPTCIDYRQTEKTRVTRRIRVTMKGIRVTECGGPGVLKYVDDLAHPGKPSGKQLLVRVKSAGVNPVDTYIRSGQFSPGRLPYVPGCDGSGVVEEVGRLVTKFKKGDRVYWGISNSGSYAELVLVPEKTTFHLSEGLSFAQGAAIGVPYSTAYRALVFKAHLSPGQTVLVHGASGAVGLACCQIGRALDAYVIGTAGTDEGLRLVLANGANLAFNHRQNGYADKIKGCGKTIDVIVEMLANSNLDQDFELIGQSGQIVIVGSRGRIEVDPLLTIFKEISIHGTTLDGNSEEEWEKTGQFFASGQERGWLNPVVGREFPLSEADKAHGEVIEHKGGSHGKIVLNVI